MSWLKKAAGGSVTGRVVGSCGCHSCPVSSRERSWGSPGLRLRGTHGVAGRCTQVMRKSPCGRRFPGIQANTVVRTPYLRSVSPPGHGSHCPGVSAGRRAGGRVGGGYNVIQKQNSAACSRRRDLAIVQPVGAFLHLILKE